MWAVWGIAVRGLTAAERQALIESTVSGDPTEDITGNDVEQAAYESLVRRGCVSLRRVEDDFWTWDATPRGRLALLCDQAVRAVFA